jgi:hypothetical protein
MFLVVATDGLWNVEMIISILSGMQSLRNKQLSFVEYKQKRVFE